MLKFVKILMFAAICNLLLAVTARIDGNEFLRQATTWVGYGIVVVTLAGMAREFYYKYIK